MPALVFYHFMIYMRGIWDCTNCPLALTDNMEEISLFSTWFQIPPLLRRDIKKCIIRTLDHEKTCISSTVSWSSRNTEGQNRSTNRRSCYSRRCGLCVCVCVCLCVCVCVCVCARKPNKKKGWMRDECVEC